MFTGLVRTVGRVRRIERRADDRRITIGVEPSALDTPLRDGDSVAVSGVCLTALAVTAGSFSADVSAETLACTTLGALAPDTRVNLEPAVTATALLGGHLVSGHVDGVGVVESRTPDARSLRLVFRAPDELARYIARKGSICIDGVSLTVNEVDGASFGVNVVPHTLASTTFDELRPARRVNLEVDLIARYLERLLSERGL